MTIIKFNSEKTASEGTVQTEKKGSLRERERLHQKTDGKEKQEGKNRRLRVLPR